MLLTLWKYVYPALASRLSPKEWEEVQKPDIVVEATQRKTQILGSHFPAYIPEDIDAALRKRFNIRLPKKGDAPVSIGDQWRFGAPQMLHNTLIILDFNHFLYINLG